MAGWNASTFPRNLRRRMQPNGFHSGHLSRDQIRSAVAFKMFKIVYVPVLDLPVCIDDKCGYALQDHNVRSHIRRAHNMPLSDDDFKQLEDFLNTCKKETQHADLLAVRAKYMQTTTDDYTFGPVLPAMDVVPVQHCFKCPRCAYISKQSDSVRKHMAGPDCSKSREGDSSLAPTPVKAQSVFGGNHRKLFQVFSSTPDDDTCQITKLMQKMEGSKPSAGYQGDISQMNSFAALMRFDSHLAANKISLEQAFNLAYVSKTERDKFARKLMSAYHKRAFDATEKRVYVKSHSFLDSDLSLAISGSTVDLYDARTSRLIAFIFACCLDHPNLKAHFPSSACERVVSLVACNGAVGEESLSLLHGILSSIFFDSVCDEEDSLVLFVSTSSVFRGLDKKSYRLGTANDVSPMMAALKHLAKCIAVTELYIHNTSDKTSGWERVNKATNGITDSGIFFVQHCMKMCNRLRDGEMQNVRFMVCPRHPHCAIVDGIELSLTTLGSKMRELQRKAWTMLEDDILNGVVITDGFWQACSDMQDALSDRTPGYWFGTHNANHHVQQFWSHALKTAIRPLVLNAQGEFDLKKTKNFADKCEELQRVIYVLLQTCSGAPARATELRVLQICNSPTACRNLYFSNGQLFSATFYHKCRNMQDGIGKPIVRYPDAVTAGILMAYLVIVRPVEQALVQALDQDCYKAGDKPSEVEISSTDHRDFLFVSRSQPVSGDRLRIWFEIETKSVGIPLQTNQYRQFHAGVVKNFMGGRGDAGQEKKDLRPSTSFLLHNQSGHTEQTAHDVYGVSDVDMRKLTGTEIDAFRRASQSWHEAIGMKHGPPCAFDDESSESSPVSQNGKSLSLKTTESDPEILPDILSRLEKLEETTREFMAKSHSKDLQLISLVQELRNSINVPTRRKRGVTEAKLEVLLAPPEKKQCAVSSNPQQSWTIEMRRFLNKPEAKFRSRQQEMAVNISIRAHQDTLVILPTGGGKSMTFMMSAFLKPDKVIVIIVPLVALQQDLSSRCAQAGIQATMWKDRDMAGSRIIIVSVEHVAKKEYQDFVRTLFLTDKLHAVFIDEAHLVVLWSQFRIAMQSLHEQIRPNDVTVPIIALTATSPPSMTERIATACGMQDWSLIRQQTSRPNIRYAVRDLNAKELYRSVDATLCSQLKNYNTSNCRAIVYVPTRNACDSLASTLSALSPDVPCFTYHAGLSASERTNMKDSWQHTGDGKAHVMVATSAFGCGIDIPNVRVVIHAGVPSTLVEYIQESGRAGRDGKSATSIVFNLHDHHWRTRGAHDRFPFKPEGMRSKQHVSEDVNLFGNVQDLQEHTKTCRRWLLDRFADGASPSKNCSERGMEPCDVCHPNLYNSDMPSMATGSETQRLAKTRSASLASTWSSSTASVDELREFFSRLGKNGCPVCTVQKRKLVQHEHSEDEKNWPCYRNRCLRCGIRGHGAGHCTQFKKLPVNGGCYYCTFRELDGFTIHDSGEYGCQQCRVKKTLCLCLLCFVDEELRTQMRKDLPGFGKLKSLDEVEDWLVGRKSRTEKGDKGKGVKVFLPWLEKKVLLT